MVLLQFFRETFPEVHIETLYADRESIGNEWLAYLCQTGIPYSSPYTHLDGEVLAVSFNKEMGIYHAWRDQYLRRLAASPVFTSLDESPVFVSLGGEPSIYSQLKSK